MFHGYGLRLGVGNHQIIANIDLLQIFRFGTFTLTVLPFGPIREMVPASLSTALTVAVTEVCG
jgi:hypothetical protein